MKLIDLFIDKATKVSNEEDTPKINCDELQRSFDNFTDGENSFIYSI